MTVLILGASGSAGGGVLQACLACEVVEVKAIIRRPLGVAHAMLKEFRHDNYRDFTDVEGAFRDVDACFYCLGKSVRQVSGEAEYRTITYEFAMSAARALYAKSPGAVFHFISGSGASLKSPFMWARVKAETERDLIARFEAVCWRPGSIDGVPSASEPVLYKAFRPVARVVLKPFRSLYVTAEDIGLAMILASVQGIRGRVIENAEIRDLADRQRAASR